MNTSLESMRWRCPGSKVAGIGTLNNYTLKFRRHADIQPDPGSTVYGVVWTIQDRHLEELDRLEGYPIYYTRKIVSVVLDNSLVDAIAYIMVDQSAESLPDPHYLYSCIKGYQDNDIPLYQIENAVKSARILESLYK